MSDELPTPARIIFYFKDKREASECDVLDFFENKGNAKKALSTLVNKGVLLEKGGAYKQGPHFEPMERKMQEVYKHVSELDKERETTEWIMRGSLIETFFIPYRQFLPLSVIYEVLPFERKEIENFLMRESKRGLVVFSKILSRYMPPSQIFSHSPFRFYRNLDNLSPEEVEKVKESWKIKGEEVYEEDFLFGRYSGDVADKARRYMSSRTDLINIIKERLLRHRFYQI
jgi:hypothetical protein